MLQALTDLSIDSPIYRCIGDTTNEGSMASLQIRMSTETKHSGDRFQKNVIDYAAEWESVVNTQIDAGLVEVKKLRETLNHYESKVEGLRKKTNSLESKGKTTPDRKMERLNRNEAKLEEAAKAYEDKALKQCALMEEATAQGWRDLHPLVQRLVKWETERCDRESGVLLGGKPYLEFLDETVSASSDSTPKATEENADTVDQKSPANSETSETDK
jgi:exonuclease VII small subunit